MAFHVPFVSIFVSSVQFISVTLQIFHITDLPDRMLEEKYRIRICQPLSVFKMLPLSNFSHWSSYKEEGSVHFLFKYGCIPCISSPSSEFHLSITFVWSSYWEGVWLLGYQSNMQIQCGFSWNNHQMASHPFELFAVFEISSLTLSSVRSSYWEGIWVPGCLEQFCKLCVASLETE